MLMKRRVCLMIPSFTMPRGSVMIVPMAVRLSVSMPMRMRMGERYRYGTQQRV